MRFFVFIHCLLLAALFSSPSGVYANEKHGSISLPANIHIYTLLSDSSSCIIPFNRVGNLIVIKAKVDTTEGNFILDTGAPHLVLNLTYFRDYPITTRADEDQ